MKIDPAMLMAEVRRSLEATHPERAAEMLDELEILARTVPAAVLTMPESATSQDADDGEMMIQRVTRMPRVALLLPHGWDFKWANPRGLVPRTPKEVLDAIDAIRHERNR